MINLRSKIFLFFSSYAPLFLIILIKNHSAITKNFLEIFNILDKNGNISIIGFLFCCVKIIIHPTTVLLISLLVGIYFLIYLLIKHNDLVQDKIKISKIENVTSESMTYIITYLVPFLSLKLHSVIDLYCIIILIMTIGIIYINSDMLYINPLLHFFGYRTFKISGEILNNKKKVENMFLITPRKISNINKNNIINFLQYDEGLLIASTISQKS